MRGHLLIAAALCAPTPLLADEGDDTLTEEQRAVAAGLDAFFDALRSDDKTALARTREPEALIFIHNRMDPDNPQIIQYKVSDRLENWLNSPTGLDEIMNYDAIMVDGDMAHIWGPYSFHVKGELTHCGINSMSMVKAEDGSWKLGNASFSMVPPAQCAEVGADWVDGDDN